MTAIPCTLTSIPGIGPVYAAGLMAEIGDVECFKNEAALAKYAGLLSSRLRYKKRHSNSLSLTLHTTNNGSYIEREISLYPLILFFYVSVFVATHTF